MLQINTIKINKNKNLRALQINIFLNCDIFQTYNTFLHITLNNIKFVSSSVFVFIYFYCVNL